METATLCTLPSAENVPAGATTYVQEVRQMLQLDFNFQENRESHAMHVFSLTISSTSTPKAIARKILTGTFCVSTCVPTEVPRECIRK